MKKWKNFASALSFLAFTAFAFYFNTKYTQKSTTELSSHESNTSLQEPLSLESDLAAKRSTELGQAKPEKKPEKEQSILLNDPNMSEKWGLKITNSSKAWKITRGSKDIVVAVIDTGIDLKHEDLKDNLWVNKGESGLDAKGRNKATNGLDDDKNGYVDDVYGWNFVSNNTDLSDNHGHGTHISGIIGAKGGNGKGVSGVSPNVSIMTLKYYDPTVASTNNLKNTIRAIHYAVENGAKIINYSGGGLEFSQEEKDAIKKAQQAGVLFVAAAGNEQSNSDQKKYYPADYELNNIISVTAIDPTKNILPSSNYGVLTVDIAAPGKNIYSTLQNGRYGYMTGTSQATAFVSGVAALIMANNSDFNADQVAKYIKNTGDVVESLAGKTRYNRKLNSYRALSILDKNVGATGVVAENTANLKDSFSSEKFEYKKEGKINGGLSLGFSSNLLDKIKNKNSIERSLNSRGPNSKDEKGEAE